MTLYIITSSLNIDNIITSESISPSNFYSKREYGYKDYETIKSDTLDSIILYKFIPYVDIIDDERENYPMIIEIETNTTTMDMEIIDNDRFRYQKTIWLTPDKCRFLFFSEQAIQQARLKCESSLCNKLYTYFRMDTIDSGNAQQISVFPNSKSYNYQEDDLDNDKLVNVKKGVAYGYALGQLLSVSQNTASLQKLFRQVQNYSAAIVSNGGVSIQTEVYFNKMLMLEREFETIDERKKQLIKSWEETFNKSATKCLKEIGCESYVKKKFAEAMGIPIRLLKPNQYNIEDYTKELKNYIEKVEKLEKKQLSDDFIESIPLSWEGKNDLYSRLLSYMFIDQNISVSTLRINRNNIALNIVQHLYKNGLISIIELSYLKELLDNVYNSTYFDINNTENDILKSLAAFLLKGEDYEILYTFAKENCINNMQYIIGLWGGATGYIDIPKTIIKPLLEDMKFNLLYSTVTLRTTGGEGDINQIYKNKEETMVGKAERMHPSLCQSIVDAIQNHPDFKKKYEKNIKKIEEEELTNWDDIEKIDKWKTFIQKVRPDKPTAKRAPKKQKEATYTQGTLFANPTSLFRDDDNVWEAIVDCIPEDNRLHYYGTDRLPKKDCIHKDLNWYQKMMRLPQSERGYKTKNGWKSYKQDLDSSNNREVILGFCEMRRGESWWDGCREIIKERLLSLYCRND